LTGHRKSIWLLSAYRSDSHAAWVDWLQRNFADSVHWTIRELPGRYFRWRIRGNPLSWLDRLPEDVPELILATSMVDIATIRGLHPRLAQVPLVYYFHENQFAYPLSAQQDGSIDPMMVQLYGALAADRLVFNSAYNRDSFLHGVAVLLDRFPDQVPVNVRDRLACRCQVLPVPVCPIRPGSKIDDLILWNHRWEYDKAPDVFISALAHLQQQGRRFQLALLGHRHAANAAWLDDIERRFGDAILVNGRLPRARYESWVARSAIVASTAIHEFQGLSVLEAVSAGAIPAVPDALCYPEQYAQQYRYAAGDAGALAAQLDAYLSVRPAVPDISRFCDAQLTAGWQQLLLGG
jgi:glycosyltransferase involved in cell wall biosynthesis